MTATLPSLASGRPAAYPFVAIVGQDDLKKSLILNVINPGLSGVLIRGEKGTAKSTAVRALAELLPEMVDMRTMVLVGSSTTCQFPSADGKQWVYTPRWYPAAE